MDRKRGIDMGKSDKVSTKKFKKYQEVNRRLKEMLTNRNKDK